jgi:hypothetical protein
VPWCLFVCLFVCLLCVELFCVVCFVATNDQGPKVEVITGPIGNSLSHPNDSPSPPPSPPPPSPSPPPPSQQPLLPEWS